MRKAISYMRFSSKRQEKGSSIDRQKDRLDAYLARNPDIVLIDTFKDEGVSGWTGKHATEGAMGRFMAMLEKGAIPTPVILIVEALDRFSREPAIDAYDRLSDLTRRGVTLAFLEEDAEISRAVLIKTPEILHRIWGQMSAAHSFSQRKSEYARGGWNRSIRLAESEGRAIRGHLGPPWTDIDSKSQRYVIACPRSVAVVQQIFAWRIEGVSDHGIAKLLNERAEEPMRAHVGPKHVRRGWYQSTIHRYLKDRRTLGEGQFRGGPVIPDLFPQIIDPETFDRAQAAKAPVPRRLGSDNGSKAVANLFTGVATCAACGGLMTMTRNKAKAKNFTRYLECGARKRKFECSGTGMINYPGLEQALLNNLPGIPWADIVRAENPHDPIPALDADIRTLETDLAEAERERDNAKRLMLKGEEFEAEFEPIFLAKRRAVEGMRTRLTGLSADRSRLAANADQRPALVRNAIEYRDAMEVVGPAERLVIREKLADTLRAMIRGMTCDTITKTVRIKLSDRFTFVVNMPLRKPVLVSLEWIDGSGKVSNPFNHGHPEGVPRLLVPTKLYPDVIAA